MLLKNFLLLLGPLLLLNAPVTLVLLHQAFCLINLRKLYLILPCFSHLNIIVPTSLRMITSVPFIKHACIFAINAIDNLNNNFCINSDMPYTALTCSFIYFFSFILFYFIHFSILITLYCYSIYICSSFHILFLETSIIKRNV